MAQFQKGVSGNPAGRPVGVKDRRTALREALECRGEELLSKAVERALEGDTAVLITLLSKIIPRLKPESLVIESQIVGSNPVEQATALVASTLSGNISPSVAAELMQSLANAVKIEEAGELRARIEALESRLHVGA
jgi:hypothetical protein